VVLTEGNCLIPHACMEKITCENSLFAELVYIRVFHQQNWSLKLVLVVSVMIIQKNTHLRRLAQNITLKSLYGKSCDSTMVNSATDWHAQL